MLKSLFSIYNNYSNNKKHKVFNICGIKFKFKQKNAVYEKANFVDFRSDIIECEKYWIEKFIDELSKMDFFQGYKKLIEKLDDESMETVNTVLKRIKAYQDNQKIFYNEEEKINFNQTGKFQHKILKINDSCFAYKNYFLPVNHFEYDVFYEKLFIRKLENKEKIKSLDIIDAGACCGDSALILSKLTDKNVYAFEPVSSNYENMLKTIELNDVKNIIPEKKGLSSEVKTEDIYIFENASSLKYNPSNTNNVENIEITTIDEYVKQNNLQVGLIKSDIEGMEMELLKGANETIKQFKPTLLISIYHSADDFFKIKEYIANLNLGYKIKIIKPKNGYILVGTMLIAQCIE